MVILRGSNREARMSALCQNRKWRTLLDHLVGELLEMQRYVKAKRICRF
jgi:hypothetical protein